MTWQTDTGITAYHSVFWKIWIDKGKRDETIKSNNYFHYGKKTVEKLELIIDANSHWIHTQWYFELIDAWYANKFSKDEN